MATLGNDFHKFKATMHRGGFNGFITYCLVWHHEIRYNQDIPFWGTLELGMHGIHVQCAHPAKLP